MNELELMNSEVTLDNINESLPVDETSGAVNIAVTVGKVAVYGLAAWKGTELIVKGFRKLRDRIRSRKQAKNASTEKPDDGINVPEVDEEQFD